mmetsp:Transcript_71198/g.190080  ORF Transcript_71198/g.190080 Transcript_71198/m.190080 type:complete len:113 (-) Transcript_71198:193-531(-)
MASFAVSLRLFVQTAAWDGLGRTWHMLLAAFSCWEYRKQNICSFVNFFSRKSVRAKRCKKSNANNRIQFRSSANRLQNRDTCFLGSIRKGQCGRAVHFFSGTGKIRPNPQHT